MNDNENQRKVPYPRTFVRYLLKFVKFRVPTPIGPTLSSKGEDMDKAVNRKILEGLFTGKQSNLAPVEKKNGRLSKNPSIDNSNDSNLLTSLAQRCAQLETQLRVQHQQIMEKVNILYF